MRCALCVENISANKFSEQRCTTDIQTQRGNRNSTRNVVAKDNSIYNKSSPSGHSVLKKRKPLAFTHTNAHAHLHLTRFQSRIQQPQNRYFALLCTHYTHCFAKCDLTPFSSISLHRLSHVQLWQLCCFCIALVNGACHA